MGDDLDDLARTAAEALVSAMVTDSWEAVKGRFVKLVGSRYERRLDAARAEIAATNGADRGQEHLAQARGAWAARLQDLLDDDPKAAQGLGAFLAELRGPLPLASPVSLHVQAGPGSRSVNIGTSNGHHGDNIAGDKHDNRRTFNLGLAPFITRLVSKAAERPIATAATAVVVLGSATVAAWQAQWPAAVFATDSAPSLPVAQGRAAVDTSAARPSTIQPYGGEGTSAQASPGGSAVGSGDAPTSTSLSGFSGLANLSDTQGYTLTLAFSGSLGAPTIDIADDPPGYETINAAAHSMSVTITNTTPGRNLPDDFTGDLGGIEIGGFWPRTSPLCNSPSPAVATFPEVVGELCYVEVAAFGDPGTLDPQQSEQLSEQPSLEPGSKQGPGVSFARVPKSQESAVISAIEDGPSLWAVTSMDFNNQFNAKCAPEDGNMMTANVNVLGITPHDKSLPQCQATSNPA